MMMELNLVVYREVVKRIPRQWHPEFDHLIVFYSFFIYIFSFCFFIKCVLLSFLNKNCFVLIIACVLNVNYAFN